MQEGDQIQSLELSAKWLDTLNLFNLLIKNGEKVRPIRFLIRHIISKGYDKLLYPGTSMFNLLISVPFKNRISYNKTLKVECDQIRNIVKFEYRDYSEVERNIDNLKVALKWSEICQPTEVNATFDYFLKFSTPEFIKV